MELNKTNAIKLWDERYGKQTQKQKDFSGREMHKGLYGYTDSKYGWNLDHRYPKSKGGGNKKCNIEIANHITNSEKNNKTTFTANGKQFQVQQDKGDGCYKIVPLTTSKSQNIMKKTSTNNSNATFLDKLFKSTIESGKDFAGRKVKYSESGTWKLGYYTNSREKSYDNCFIAHSETIEDQNGKTNFKTNGKHFTLKNTEDGYRFLCTNTIEDLNDYANVMAYTNKLFKNDTTVNRDVLRIKTVFNSNYCSKLMLLLEELLKDNEFYLSTLYSENQDNYFSHNIDMYIVFNTPTNESTCKVHEFAIYVNTLLSAYLEEVLNEYLIVHATYSLKQSDYSSFMRTLNSSDYLKFEDTSNYYNSYYGLPSNSIVVTKNVKNYLGKCKYQSNTFKETNVSGMYSRNYIYNGLKHHINN